MTSQPLPTNPTTTVVNQGIDGVFKVAVTAVEAALIAEDPAIFANPIIEYIDDGVVEYVANKIYQQFAEWVSFEIIVFQTSGEITDEQKALAALKAAQLSGNQNAIQAALTAFDQATASLTHMDGVASVGSV